MNLAEIKLLTDSSLSDEARLIGLLIASNGGEWAEYHRDDFRRLLHGAVSKDRVARSLGELELYGYVERKVGGQGHGDSFRFSVQAVATVKNSVQATETLNANSVQAMATLSRTPSPPTDISPPPPSIAGARPADTDIARLRQYLGEHARAVDMMLESADHSPTWIAAVLGKYGPSGTQVAVFRGIPPDRWPVVVADSLMEYATDRKPYGNRIFDGYVRKTAGAELRRGSTSLAATGTDGGGNPRGSGGAPRSDGRAERGQDFQIE